MERAQSIGRKPTTVLARVFFESSVQRLGHKLLCMPQYMEGLAHPLPVFLHSLEKRKHYSYRGVY